MTLEPYFSSSRRVWDSTLWVEGIEKCGYCGWEVVADGLYRFDSREAFHQITETLSTSRLGATVHAPYSDLNCASLNYPIWRESIRQICTCITQSAEITERVTFHPGYISPVGKLVPDKVWDLQKTALREIGRCAQDSGVLACLENMGGIREFLCRFPEEIMGMIEDIEGIGLTIDLGHANTIGIVKEFLVVVDHADHLHIHDNGGAHDEHLALGEGTIDWEYAGKVVRERYGGIVVIEGRTMEEAAQSMGALRRWFL